MTTPTTHCLIPSPSKEGWPTTTRRGVAGRQVEGGDRGAARQTDARTVRDPSFQPAPQIPHAPPACLGNKIGGFGAREASAWSRHRVELLLPRVLPGSVDMEVAASPAVFVAARFALFTSARLVKIQRRRKYSAASEDEIPILQFRIWLQDVSPMMWRRVQVLDDAVT
ncbi:hypothetical protein [Mesorhizobium sp.]|uniref:hypothetical protein n=1 Tax=Mesorhizobium sp. TaxID=1871066 RepID=UPI0025FF307D|nr:hypothetical protein [Mesorhizobium sp.]